MATFGAMVMFGNMSLTPLSVVTWVASSAIRRIHFPILVSITASIVIN